MSDPAKVAFAPSPPCTAPDDAPVDRDRDMSSVVAGVDPGFRNLGVALVDVASQTSVFWRRLELFGDDEHYDATKVYARVRDVCERLRLRDCQWVIIEQQLQRDRRMTAIEAAFAMYCVDNAFIVSPRSYKRAFDLASGDYRRNKALAVQFVCDHILRNLSGDTTAFGDGQPDMADAMLLIHFARVHLNDQARQRIASQFEFHSPDRAAKNSPPA